MKRSLLIAILPALLLCGCLTIEQSLSFKRDGSVIVTCRYSFPAEREEAIRACLAAIAEKQKTAAPDSTAGLSFLDEEAVTAFCRTQRLELRQYRRVVNNDGDGTCTIRIVMLARDAAVAVNGGAFGAFKLSKNTDDGKTRCEAIMPPGASTGWTPELRRRLRTLAPDFTLKLSIIPPDGVPVQWSFAVADDTIFSPPSTLSTEW